MVLGLSEGLTRCRRRRHSIDIGRDRIFVCHDGVDTQAICPDEGATFLLPNGRVLDRTDEVITYAARHLEPYRGFHVFMRLLPRLLKLRPKAQVLVVGDESSGYGAAPPGHTSWRQHMSAEMSGQWQSSDFARVHFFEKLGRADFTRLLQVSRLHLYWSYPFVPSWSLIEAMSAGACILASDTAPVREVLEDGTLGRLVDFFSHDAWLQQAQTLLDDKSQRAAFSRAARQSAVKGFDLQSVCLPQQMAWVENLLQKRN